MINALFWNIKGVSKTPNLRRLIRLIHMHNVQFLSICEPKLDVSKLETICLRLLFDSVMVNMSTDICVFYKSPFVCLLVGSSDQYIALYIHHPSLPGSLVFFWVHARCSVEARKDLWKDLLLDKPWLRPWCIGGTLT